MNGYREQKQNQKNAHNARVGIGRKRGRMSNGGYWQGKKFSEEHKNKIRISMKNYVHTEEHKRNISAGKIGHIVTEETRRKISKKQKGRVSWNKGKSWSKESKSRMSISAKKRLPNRKGEKQSELTKQKLRLIRLNQVIPTKNTSIEVKIQNFLKQLNIEFTPHKPITNIKHIYQCDIFIPSKNLIIECDGNYWHNYPIGKFMDYVRNEEIKEAGFNLLRLWEQDINRMNLNEFELLLCKT